MRRLFRCVGSGLSFDQTRLSFVLESMAFFFEWDQAGVGEQQQTDGGVAGVGRPSGYDNPIWHQEAGAAPQWMLEYRDSFGWRQGVGTHNLSTFGATNAGQFALHSEVEGLDGLVNMNARWYDPRVGRFLGTDPIMHQNAYVYVQNNPVKFHDPTGMKEEGGDREVVVSIIEMDPLLITAAPPITPESGADSGDAIESINVGPKDAPSPGHADFWKSMQAAALFTVDFAPVIGDAKGIYEAYQNPTPVNVFSAGIGILGPLGDVAGKALKAGAHADELVVAVRALDALAEGASNPPVLKAAKELTDDVIKGIDNSVLGKPRIGSANKTDTTHRFNDIIDNYAGEAAKFDIPTKGPGGQVVRTAELRQIEGSLNGKDGVFEWIIDQGNVTHRRFIPGGQVTGFPNQVPKK